MAREQFGFTLEPDEDLTNADWTKQGWDFPTDIDSAKKMRDFIEQNLQTTVEHFKTLPVYKLNLGKIKWLKKL